MLEPVITAAHMPTARLFGLEAAAVYLDTTPRTVQRLVARGLLQPVKIDGLRRTLFDRRDLDALIEHAKRQSEQVTSSGP